MKRMVILLVIAVLMFPGVLAAQQSGGGQGQPAPGQPPAPMTCCPGMTMCPQMMQQMQQTMQQMQQLMGQGKLSPEAMKQMQDMVAKMQEMMKQMQGMMQTCPMMKGPQAPQPQKK